MNDIVIVSLAGLLGLVFVFAISHRATVKARVSRKGLDFTMGSDDEL